ncbi:MAG: FixH family protein [Saprospiraceae bacterium]|nr:FixH family protein [Candidatus Vicinibacter proximus]
MTMNFGHKVLIVYIIGALGIIFMVVLSLNIDFEMAEDNYYAKEEKMEHYLEGKRNTSNLEGGIVQLSVDQNFIVVKINPTLDTSLLKGELHFYYPPAKALDKKMEILPPANYVYSFARSEMGKGKSILKVSLETAGKFYYDEISVVN